MSFDFLAPIGQFFVEKQLNLIVPELIVLLFLLAAVGHMSFAKSQPERNATWNFAFAGVVLAFVSVILFFQTGYFDNPAFTSLMVFNGMFKADLLSLLVRFLLLGGTLIVLLFSRTFVERELKAIAGEFYIVLLGALLGALFLSGSQDLVMMFVSLETLSISSYVMVGMLRGNVLSAEAGLKYLLYGGVATAVLLFGLSILYGLTGSTAYGAIASGLETYQTAISPLLLSVMTVSILGGIAFKLSAAPFHMWAPDTYEGAPTPVVAFLSVVSKIAGFALALRIFELAFSALPGWEVLMVTLSLLSMIVGNFVALTQKNLKRLLAYSTVAHVGYLLLAFVAMTESALGSMLFYLMTYLFMNLGAFAVVTHLENLTGQTDIHAYSGLVRKKPFLTLVLSVMLLSLAGIPVTAGFFGKFFLFQSIVTDSPQYLWLVVVALLTSTVSLYYYLNVIRVMVIPDPSETVKALFDKDAWFASVPPLGLNLSLLICLLFTLGLGIFSEQALLFSKMTIHKTDFLKGSSSKAHRNVFNRHAMALTKSVKSLHRIPLADQ
jgi:NAD(P)H-quinone oxidoreductase subunit 2